MKYSFYDFANMERGKLMLENCEIDYPVCNKRDTLSLLYGLIAGIANEDKNNPIKDINPHGITTLFCILANAINHLESENDSDYAYLREY